MQTADTVDQEIDTQILMKFKRDQFAVEIRKKKNADVINSKRMKFSKTRENNLDDNLNPTTKVDGDIQQFFREKVSDFYKALKELDYVKLCIALSELRMLISSETQVPIDYFYTARILPEIARLLDDPDILQHIQSEVLWILINVASLKDQDTEYVVESLNGIERVLNILPRAKDENLIDDCVWLLGNIAVCSVKYRDSILEYNIIEYMVHHLETKTIRLSHLKNWTWLVSNLCTGKSLPDYKKVRAVLPFLEDCLKAKDDELIENVLWTFTSLSEGDTDQLDEVINFIPIRDVIDYAKKDSKSELRTPSIRIIGNFLSGTNEHTAILVKEGVIELLGDQLKSSQTRPKLEALWSLSNILADSEELISKVLEYKEIIPKIVYLLHADTPDVQKEALHCVNNMAAFGSNEQIHMLVELKIIESIVDILKHNRDADFLGLTLECLENVLDAGQKQASTDNPNLYLLYFEKVGGVLAIQELQNHQNSKVYERVSALIDKYFDSE